MTCICSAITGNKNSNFISRGKSSKEHNKVSSFSVRRENCETGDTFLNKIMPMNMNTTTKTYGNSYGASAIFYQSFTDIFISLYSNPPINFQLPIKN